MSILHNEVMSLLSKEAIEEIDASNAKFISGLFVIPKSGGGYRPILNLKPVNSHVTRMHFKMEGISLLKHMIRKGDYFAKLDLKDAYLTVPMCLEHRRYLQFE